MEAQVFNPALTPVVTSCVFQRRAPATTRAIPAPKNFGLLIQNHHHHIIFICF